MANPIVIWKRSNTTATAIEIIDDYVSYQYQKGFNSTGSFTLILPAKNEYFKAVIREQNRDKIVQFDKDFFGIIYGVQISQQSGVKRLTVKGKHLTSLMGHYMRGVPGLPGSKLNVHSTDVATDIEYFWNGAKPNEGESVQQFVTRHYTDPDFWYPVTRELKFSKVGYVGNWTSTGYFDSTWVNWLDYMETMSQNENFGFDVKMEDDGYMRLTLSSPEEKDPDEMLLATDFGDIVSSTYEENSQQYYNHCTVCGQARYEGVLELYNSQDGAQNLDASQGKFYGFNVDCSNMGEPGVSVLPDFLRFQNQGFLTKHRFVKTYDAKINLKNLKYKLGTDYKLGDYIWVWDSELKVDVKAQFLAYKKTVKNSVEQINPTFGFDQIGLSKLLRRNGVI